MFINEIAKKFIRTYTMLTKEEKITIYSAQVFIINNTKELTSQEQTQVREALESNPDNAGKTFIIDFLVNFSAKLR